MGNFNSLMAIIAGMNMTWVSRLKKTVRNKLLYMTKTFLFKPSNTGLEIGMSLDEIILGVSSFSVVTGKPSKV